MSLDEKAEAAKAAENVIGRSQLKCQPIGIGSAAPHSRITNLDLEKQVFMISTTYHESLSGGR